MTEANGQAEIRKGGAPFGNRNATTRHGLRGSRLPEGCEYIRKCIYQYRRALEARVAQVRRTTVDELPLEVVSIINAAMTHETHAQLCQRWRAMAETTEERRICSRDACEAREKRMRCEQRLGLTLDANHGDLLDNLPDIPSNATTARTEPQNGSPVE